MKSRPRNEKVQDKWRISPFADLSGRGGVLVDGRWHTAGRPLVYLAESPTAALLETLVHMELDSSDDLPETFQLLRVGFRSDVSLIELDPDSLPAGWREDILLTQSVGDEWLEDGDSLLLAVPSAIAPATTNYLYNPQHPDADHAEVDADQHPFDQRLFFKR